MNQEAAWVQITPGENIPVREGRVTAVRGRQIAIFNLGDRFLAVDNRCPHQGGPLAEGMLTGTAVVCPLHAWKIDLETGGVGNSASPTACVATFPTRLREGILEIQIPFRAVEREAVSLGCAHRDRPIRWVQRKQSAALPSPSGIS